ncbi:hypothetical protein Efla_002930 [Eimeria flavescens]
METASKGLLLELEKKTTRRADALIADGGDGQQAQELEVEFEALRERLRALNNAGELSDALSNQQQRVRVLSPCGILVNLASDSTWLCRRCLNLQAITRASEALTLHIQRLSRPSSFSFKRRVAATPASRTPVEPSAEPSQAAAADTAAHVKVKTAAAPPSNVLRVSGLCNAVLLIGPGVAKEREIWLRDLDGCTVYVVDSVPAARLHEIRNSAVCLLRVASAVWIQNSSKCLFAVGAQQLRVHDCLDVSFFLNTASSPIIERTSQAVFAPPLITVELEEEGKQAQSPNWRLLRVAEPRVHRVRCIRRASAREASQGEDAESAEALPLIAAQCLADLSEIASRDWRLLRPPQAFSALALKQHASAADAAEAAVDLSLRRPAG